MTLLNSKAILKQFDNQNKHHICFRLQSKAIENPFLQSELARTVQELTEKAKRAHEGVGVLRTLQERCSESAEAIKAAINAQIDSLLYTIDERRAHLLAFVDGERDARRTTLREQIARSNAYLARTSGLIQFCIEILKEVDAVAYLQVSATSNNNNKKTSWLNAKFDFIDCARSARENDGSRFSLEQKY